MDKLFLLIARRYASARVQEKLSKGALSEARAGEEARRARERADDAENQLTRAELLRRSLEGDNQRLKLALSDKENESQASCSFRLTCQSL